MEIFGVIIKHKNEIIYHTSDTHAYDNPPGCSILFVPINNRGLCLGPQEAADFANLTNAKVVVPFHYDSPKDANRGLVSEFETAATKYSYNVKVLEFAGELKINES